MQCGSAMYPGAAKLLGKESAVDQPTGLNPLGSTGSNIFFCTNYLSPQHVDRDHTLSVCVQLQKNSQPDEFNFSYTEWGVYIKTIPNCAW